MLVVTLASCSASKSTSSTPTKPKQKKGSTELSEREKMAFDRHFFDAMAQKSLNNPAKAKTSFNECLVIDPKNAAVNYELARIDYDEGAISSAQERIELSIAGDATNFWYWLFKSDILFETGDFKGAVSGYQKALKIDPSQIDIYFDLAAAQLYLEDADAAIKSYNELQARIGVTEEISIQKHQLHLEVENVKAAEQDLLELSEAFPDEPRYLGMLAQFYEQTGDPEKANLYLERMVEIDPSNGFVQLFLSESYAMKGEDEKSFQALKMAFQDPELEIDKKVNLLLNYFVISEQNLTAKVQAFELLGILIVKHPSEAKSFALAGDYYYRDGDRIKALEMYHKAIELDPSRSLIWLQVLNIDSELNQMEQLDIDSKTALELFPTQPEIYLYRGIALERLKKSQEAADVLNIGKELVFDNDPLQAEFYSILGDVYHGMKDNAKSDKAYDSSLKLNPKNAFVLNNYAYYLSLRREKLEKASTMAAEANNIVPGQPSFQDTYAWILFQLGKYSEALVWQEKAMAAGGSNSGEILEHYGDILFKLGEKQKALEQWRKAQLTNDGSILLDRKIEEQRYIDELE